MPPSSAWMTASGIGWSPASSRLFCGRFTLTNSRVPVGELELRPDPHRRIGMKEVETRSRFDPEEQVQKRRQRRRFACLVRTVDDVQVGLVLLPLAEVDAARPVNSAVAGEIEPPDAASASPPFARACSRARTSSAPSRASRQNEGLKLGLVGTEEVPAFRRQLRPQLLADATAVLPKASDRSDLALDQPAQLHDRIARGRRQASGGCTRPPLSPRAAAGRGGPIVHLRPQEIEIAPDAPRQRRCADDAQARHEMLRGHARPGFFQRFARSRRRCRATRRCRPASTATRSNCAMPVCRSSIRIEPSSAIVDQA